MTSHLSLKMDSAMKNKNLAGYVKYIGQVTSPKKRYEYFHFSQLNGKRISRLRTTYGLEVGDKVWLAKLRHIPGNVHVWDIHEILLPECGYGKSLPKTWFGNNSVLVE